MTERTQGRINVRVYPGSQLVGGDQTREPVAMRQGVIDFVNFSTINIAPQVREMNLFTLPWLLGDHRGFEAIVNGEIGETLFRALRTREIEPMAWGENGFREISNSRRPIRAPADMRGLRIRFAAGVIFSEIFAALGANPLQMSFADLQPALSTGAVDGQENPINLFLAFRMDMPGSWPSPGRSGTASPRPTARSCAKPPAKRRVCGLMAAARESGSMATAPRWTNWRGAMSSWSR